MIPSESIEIVEDQITSFASITEAIRQQMHTNIIGQQSLIDRLLIGLYCNGHLLLEGVPGLAKTLAIRSLSQCLQLQFSRIQFTPDLLPADVVGTMIYHQSKGEFMVRKGPIFANFVLADEINRAPAKVQSALLEAMQERQVTIGDETYFLEEPFLVLATQNPIDQEGTYSLPEAQQDRFFMKILVDYPTMEEERFIIKSHIDGSNETTITAVATAKDIVHARQLVRKVYMDEKLEQYLLDIVFATRFPAKYRLNSLQPLISYGASPRASISLALAARAHAMLQGRAYVIPDDVQTIVPDILRHRIGLTYEAEAEDIDVEKVITTILKTLPAP